MRVVGLWENFPLPAKIKLFVSDEFPSARETVHVNPKMPAFTHNLLTRLCSGIE